MRVKFVSWDKYYATYNSDAVTVKWGTYVLLLNKVYLNDHPPILGMKRV